MNAYDRRDFLRTLGGSIVGGAGAWAALESLTAARAAESAVSPDIAQFRPEMEPIVRWIESTPRDRIMSATIEQLQQGLSYRQLLGGLFLAGIRNIKPRPVGFKFHAVMVIHSAHDLSLDAPQQDRLLPFFWALDNFKSSQQRDVDEGDWVLSKVVESSVPGPDRARRMFSEAMERWDEEAADVAIVGLCRSAGIDEIKESLWHYGARDWQNIGHKIIFTAHAFRTLDTIGWEHAEPVIRSLVFGLLNGGPGDSVAPYATNVSLVPKVRADWAAGKPDAAAAHAMLETMRQAGPEEAARAALETLNRGVAARSVWDGVMLAAGELLMRQPGIVALHAVTASNSMHYAFRAASQDSIRLLALLQACSWIPLYREGVRSRSGLPDTPRIDKLEPAESASSAAAILENLKQDRLASARQVLSIAGDREAARSFMDAARHLVFTKGTDSHDYKFAAAAFEEFRHASSECQPPLLAASVYHLKAASDSDSPLLERVRKALAVL